MNRASPSGLDRPLARSHMAPPDPASVLADALADQAHRWAVSQGADADTAAVASQAAHALSLATSEGHVCLTLAQLTADATSGSASTAGAPQTPAAWRTALLSSGIVGTPQEPGAKPLLLDEEDRLYLHRDFALERRLANRLAACLAVPPQALPTGILPGTADGADTATDWPTLAAALALRHGTD